MFIAIIHKFHYLSIWDIDQMYFVNFIPLKPQNHNINMIIRLSWYKILYDTGA